MTRVAQRLVGPWLLAGLLAAAGAGCAASHAEGAGALSYAENAEKAYQRALKVLKDKDYEEARALFQELRRKYSYSRYARLAELRIADADFASEKVPEAIQEYRGFVHDHRADEEVPYARLRIVTGLYDEINDTIFLPPNEERDQSPVMEAHKELVSFIKDYPRSPQYDSVYYMLRIVTGRLVRHELYVARYYLKRDNFEAARARIQYAIEKYAGSDLDPEAMVLLGETFLLLHKREEAKEAFDHLLAQYPSSPFAVPARHFLEQMGAVGH